MKFFATPLKTVALAATVVVAAAPALDIASGNVRGSALVERRKEYVEAAIGQGLPALRVMFVHILPNCMAPLLVTATLQALGAPNRTKLLVLLSLRGYRVPSMRAGAVRAAD